MALTFAPLAILPIYDKCICIPYLSYPGLLAPAYVACSTASDIRWVLQATYAGARYPGLLAPAYVACSTQRMSLAVLQATYAGARRPGYKQHMLGREGLGTRLYPTFKLSNAVPLLAKAATRERKLGLRPEIPYCLESPPLPY